MTNNNDNIKKSSLQKRGYRYVYPGYSYKFSIMIYTKFTKTDCTASKNYNIINNDITNSNMNYCWKL